jgi:hypothetical protein
MSRLICHEQDRAKLHRAIDVMASETDWRDVAHDILDRALTTTNKERAYILKLEARIASLEETTTSLKGAVDLLNQELATTKGWGFVYLMKGDSYYKIGYSKRPPQRRVDISPKLPFELQLIHAIEADNARALEMQLHERFTEKRLRGEWFRLTEQDVAYIKSL